MIGSTISINVLFIVFIVNWQNFYVVCAETNNKQITIGSYNDCINDETYTVEEGSSLLLDFTGVNKHIWEIKCFDFSNENNKFVRKYVSQDDNDDKKITARPVTLGMSQRWKCIIKDFDLNIGQHCFKLNVIHTNDDKKTNTIYKEKDKPSIDKPNPNNGTINPGTASLQRVTQHDHAATKTFHTSSNLVPTADDDIKMNIVDKEKEILSTDKDNPNAEFTNGKINSPSVVTQHDKLVLNNVTDTEDNASNSKTWENDSKWILPLLVILLVCIIVLCLCIIIKKRNNNNNRRKPVIKWQKRDQTLYQKISRRNHSTIKQQLISTEKDYAIPIDYRVDDITYTEPYRAETNCYTIPTSKVNKNNSSKDAKFENTSNSCPDIKKDDKYQRVPVCKHINGDTPDNKTKKLKESQNEKSDLQSLTKQSDINGSNNGPYGNIFVKSSYVNSSDIDRKNENITYTNLNTSKSTEEPKYAEPFSSNATSKSLDKTLYATDNSHYINKEVGVSKYAEPYHH